MYNWNTNTIDLEKKPEKFKIWKLEQIINFGLNGEKLDKKAAAIQRPIGSEENFIGIIDLIEMKALYFPAENLGSKVESKVIKFFYLF